MEGVLDGGLQDPAVLSDDVVGLDDLGPGQQFPGPRVPERVAAVRVDADEGLDAVAEAGRGHVGGVTGDRARALQSADPLRDRRRAEHHAAAQLAELDAAVALEQFQDLPVQRVEAHRRSGGGGARLPWFFRCDRRISHVSPFRRSPRDGRIMTTDGATAVDRSPAPGTRPLTQGAWPLGTWHLAL